MVEGHKGVAVKIECKNVSQFFVNYMQNLNMLSKLKKNKKKCTFAFLIKSRSQMEKSAINKATSDKISFMTYIVPAFADAYKMNAQDAYFYLKKYGAWDFLNEHWWALHTDNVLYTLDDLYEVCHENGGLR